MHEVIGHGSGMLDPKLTHDPAFYIKEYYSTLEETRADLMALWNFWDPKLIEMGAMPSDEVAKTAYDGEARAALTQLHEVPTGDTIEEDHRRGTQLIVNYIRDKTGAIQPVEQNGKVYLVVTDYAKMRQGVGMLLAELMRIKAEGDYDAAKDLITKYGIHFNLAWRDQVVARYKALDVPKLLGGHQSRPRPSQGLGRQVGRRHDQLSARYGEAAVAIHEDRGRITNFGSNRAATRSSRAQVRDRLAAILAWPSTARPRGLRLPCGLRRNCRRSSRPDARLSWHGRPAMCRGT